jgi:hypothetical protein
VSESSKVGRRRFLKYLGTGLAAATVAGAGYYLYGMQRGGVPSQTITIPKGWESATTYLASASTRRTAPEPEWWKNAKVVTGTVDYWQLLGKQYVEDARIEVMDSYSGGLLDRTPALGWRKGWKFTIDEVHSKGLDITGYEALFVTKHGPHLFVNGEMLPAFGNIPSEGEVEYPLRALYQSPYWSDYFAEKWRNPDGSEMEDPIQGGCARNLQNEPVEFPEWNWTFMSIHNPHYLDYVKKCVEIDVDDGVDGIHFDLFNLPAFAYWRGGGDFSPWAEHKFRAYLSETHAREELSRMGVGKVDDFSLRRYILDKAYSGAPNIADPIIRTWSEFEYDAFDGFLSQVYAHLKDYASSAACKTCFSISGNIYNLLSDSPFSVLGAKYSDVIWLEHGFEIPPPGRLSLIVRQGWALSRSKPVWLHFCAGSREIAEYIKMDYAGLLGTMFAQVYSAGGVYLANRLYAIPFGVTDTHPMGPRSSKLIISYCRFVHENKRHFLDAKPSLSSVAIAYTLPTMMAGYYPCLSTIRSWEWDHAAAGIAHVLDREHIPFDFVALGHPRFWDDSETLAHLSQYNILVLSNAEAVTDEQTKAIRTLVEAGGGLLSLGVTATRDGEYKLRTAPALADLTRPGLQTIHGGKTLHLSSNPGYSYWKHVIEERREDPSNYKTIRDAVMSLSRRPRTIETNASDTVSVNILQQGNRSLQVHLVNLDYNEEDDSIPEKDGLRIKVKVPSGFSVEGKEGALMTPDGNGSPQRLEYSLLEGYVELEVPHLRIYSIAAIYDPHL